MAMSLLIPFKMGASCSRNRTPNGFCVTFGFPLKAPNNCSLKKDSPKGAPKRVPSKRDMTHPESDCAALKGWAADRMTLSSQPESGKVTNKPG